MSGIPVASPVRPFTPERRSQNRSEEGAEFGGAAGLHLDQKRLALMQAHAAGLSHRLVTPCPWTALLVQSVPGFMKHAHQGAGRARRVVTGGDADIVGGAAAERMEADIEPSTVSPWKRSVWPPEFIGARIRR